MASNNGAVATEAAPPPTRTSPAPPANVATDDPVRLLKRQRESGSTSPRSNPSHQTNPLGSPTKSARLALATTQALAPLTGAAALEDERRQREEEQRIASPAATSPNPSHAALASLMSGATEAISRPSDAPPPVPTAAMDSVAKAASALSIPANSTGRADERGETSPHSTSSMAGAPVTESPTPMDIDNKPPEPAASQQVAGQDDRPQPGSLSYPGSLQATAGLAETPTRGMSYPMPSGSPTSSGSKKHKCPYCSTEFTRHHNLKSHLLTHSQEKPFLCTDCQMRFRRLHDLKRHGKLHTGEKPHVCPICERKFARGDALARHSKGAGGCAGRRSSMGSFADGDELDGMGEGDESTMSGIAYDSGDEELRRQSLPNASAQQLAGQGEGLVPVSRTYPPASRPGSGLYPPNVNQVQTSTSPSAPNSMASSHTTTSASSAALSGGGAGMYSQGGVTESPKPLSPGIQGNDASAHARQRSESLSQQLQQSGRRHQDSQSGSQSRPKLPGLSHPGYGSQGSGAFPPGRSGTGSTQAGGESGNMFAQSDPSVWAYIQTMEEKIKSLSDMVVSLDQEVLVLKKQLDGRDAATTAAATAAAATAATNTTSSTG